MGQKKRRPKKRWKEVLECNMITRDSKMLDAQDRERWRLSCKNWLTPAGGEHQLGSRNKKTKICTLKEQNDDDEEMN